MEALRSAGNQLRSALDQYLSVCSSIQHRFSQGGASNVSERCLHHIVTEMAHFSTYPSKLKEAEVSISQVYNNLSQIVPINQFPPEIMTHIFHLVPASEPCNLRLIAGAELDPQILRRPTRSRVENFPMYPDYLAQVCTRWRRIALASPSLWSHLDFTPDDMVHVGMLARANCHQERAKTVPLILHLYESNDINWDKHTLEEFLTSIANRIKLLDFTIIRSSGLFTSLIFEGLLPGCASESSNFTQLTVIYTGACDSPHFSSADEDETHAYGRLVLNTPHSVIEDSFRRISILHSHGFFPSWSSAAYNNLVDLRLSTSPNSSWNSIPESGFRNILAQSPQLQILHVALKLTHKTQKTEPVSPIILENLEIVNITSYRPFGEGQVLELGDVLRHLAPGLRPLQLSVCYRDYYSSYGFSRNELIKFFQRAKITKFYSKYTPPIRELLCYAPNIQDLAIYSDSTLFGSMEGFQSIPIPQLNSLILDGRYTSEWIQELDIFLQDYPTKRIIFLNGCFSDERTKQMLQENYPNIEVFHHSFDNLLPDSLVNADVFSICYSKLPLQ
ncbi:hypothetical protein ACGC1H_000280 [Rhizoctonia solani]